MAPLPKKQKNKSIRILHIITGLDVGGTETALLRLLQNLDPKHFQCQVLSLLKPGHISTYLAKEGIIVHTADLVSSFPSIVAMSKILAIVRKVRPHIIQGWMYHGNLVASMSALFLGYRPKVLWNIRQSLSFMKSEKKTTAAIIRLGAYLSYFPHHIIYNAHSSAAQHHQLGYRPDKTIIIANGFDTSVFCPSLSARKAVFSELGIPPHSHLIGIIGRFHPVKDHKTFIQAAGLLSTSNHSTYFMAVGNGVSPENVSLQSWIRKAKLQSRIFLLGERHNIPHLTAAMDIATCCSRAEALANSVGEAMSCGVPCVVTDVGDLARIVANTGIIIPQENPYALARAWQKILQLPQDELVSKKIAARDRIIQSYSLANNIKQYQQLYQQTLKFP